MLSTWKQRSPYDMPMQLGERVALTLSQLRRQKEACGQLHSQMALTREMSGTHYRGGGGMLEDSGRPRKISAPLRFDPLTVQHTPSRYTIYTNYIHIQLLNWESESILTRVIPSSLIIYFYHTGNKIPDVININFSIYFGFVFSSINFVSSFA
jgi:hypothetical protein